jgi:hypothetical protein
MGNACARLINEYVVRSERWSYAVNEVVSNGRSISWLRGYGEGELRSAAENAFGVGQDRTECGMKLNKPNDFPRDDVVPVDRAWEVSN